jgi:cytochrome c-type biogenesis protein CcsB
MAIWSCIFGVAVIATVSKFSVFTEVGFRSGLFIPNPNGGKPFPSPFRLALPYAGPALAVAGILLLGVAVAYTIYVFKDSEPARKAGSVLIKLAFVAQIVSLIFVITGMNADRNVQAELQAQLAADPTQWVVAGKAIAEKQDLSATEFAALQPSQLERMAQDNLQRFGGQMFTDLNTNPVEVSGLITALAGTFFILLFGFKTEKLRERLPSLDSLDGLMYKTASLAFAGLAMLLITGAIWANESWGRPWGFDSKETGALIAWLTYAAFLHTRISRGWKGRSSAYFAIIGFLLVIFTYLGVSYLLPGLHSYA